jgi:hypothetical protein
MLVKKVRREGTLTLPSPANNAGEGIKGIQQKTRSRAAASCLIIHARVSQPVTALEPNLVRRLGEIAFREMVSDHF